MGLVVKDDGWRIPDELWAEMEPLLPPRLECPQAAADRAFIPLEGLHQFFMATDDNASGALMIRH
jgi:hypothetical protein